MKFREVTLADGTELSVPQGIQRIDTRSTHGWQVRCQGTKFFSDGPTADVRQSLIKATRELIQRLTTLPAPSGLKLQASPSKTSDLPPGISGPIVRERPGRAPSAALSVLVPRFGKAPQNKTVYIASQSTYSEERYLQALAKGLAIRAQAIERYEEDASKARRKAGALLRAQLRAPEAKSTQGAKGAKGPKGSKGSKVTKGTKATKATKGTQGT